MPPFEAYRGSTLFDSLQRKYYMRGIKPNEVVFKQLSYHKIKTFIYSTYMQLAPPLASQLCGINILFYSALYATYTSSRLKVACKQYVIPKTCLAWLWLQITGPHASPEITNVHECNFFKDIYEFFNFLINII